MLSAEKMPAFCPICRVKPKKPLLRAYGFALHLWESHGAIGVSEAHADALRIMRSSGKYVSVTQVATEMGVYLHLYPVLGKLEDLGCVSWRRVNKMYLFRVHRLPKIYVMEDYIRVIKRGERAYVCPKCGRVFLMPSSFMWHMIKHGYLPLKGWREEEMLLRLEEKELLSSLYRFSGMPYVFTSRVERLGMLRRIGNEAGRVIYEVDVDWDRVIRVEDFEVKPDRTVRVDKIMELVKVPVGF